MYRLLCKLVAAAALLATAGCGSGSTHDDPRTARAEARGFYYTDQDGLDVVTVVAGLEQPLPSAGTILVGATFDDVSLDPVDGVSSASIRAEDGDPSLDEQRYELALGYRDELGSRTTPMTLEGVGLVSVEADYLALSAKVGWTGAFFEQNTTLALAAAYGHDETDPNRVLHPADVGRWPAGHDRLSASAGVVQLLTPRLSLNAGATYSLQSGALSSPYRRALVERDGELVAEAERHPDVRGRGTAYVGASWYLGWNLALHPRLGGYADTWGVEALMPEVSLVFEPVRPLLLTAYYRYYLQSRADFYEPRYDTLEPLRSGDRRLGSTDGNIIGGQLVWTFIGEPDRPGAFDLLAAYQLTLLSYNELTRPGPGSANVLSLGLGLTY